MSFVAIVVLVGVIVYALKLAVVLDMASGS